jgi:hypothetical protein
VTAVRSYDEYRGTPLWRALAGIVADLEASREISVATASDYVIGYLCRELAAKALVAPAALGDRR